MGVYNTVFAEAGCVHCGKPQEFGVQYKFGEQRCHEYRLGDVITNDARSGIDPATARLLTPGCGPCAACGTLVEFEVEINRGQLVRVTPRLDELLDVVVLED